jgi:hypothetical protein
MPPSPHPQIRKKNYKSHPVGKKGHEFVNNLYRIIQNFMLKEIVRRDISITLKPLCTINIC